MPDEQSNLRERIEALEKNLKRRDSLTSKLREKIGGVIGGGIAGAIVSLFFPQYGVLDTIRAHRIEVVDSTDKPVVIIEAFKQFGDSPADFTEYGGRISVLSATFPDSLNRESLGIVEREMAIIGASPQGGYMRLQRSFSDIYWAKVP